MSDLRDGWKIDPNAVDLIHVLGIRTLEDGWNPTLPGRVINDRGDRQVVELIVPGTGQVVYLKRWRFAPSSPYRFLPGHRDLRLRARSEWNNLHILKRIGVRVPEPYLLAERENLIGPEASILLIEGLSGYTHAAEWLVHHPANRGSLCRSIGVLFRLLHTNKLFYRSPGLKHFFVSPEGLAAPLALIDVPRLDRPHATSNLLAHVLSRIDFPGPLRDLSKVLITIRYEVQASEDEIDGFWKSYFDVEQFYTDQQKLMAKVGKNAQQRLRSRSSRQIRKYRNREVIA